MGKITNRIIILCVGILFGANIAVFAQNSNCFLEDFQPKAASIPISAAAAKTNDAPTVTVTLAGDTLGKISKYVFGNAIAAWMGNNTGNSVFLANTKALN